MIRIVVENVLLFLLPTVVYVAYVLMMRHSAADDPSAGRTSPANVLDDAPLLWLFGAGAILVVVTLVAFGSTSGGKPGQHYEPPSLSDGKINPAEIK